MMPCLNFELGSHPSPRFLIMHPMQAVGNGIASVPCPYEGLYHDVLHVCPNNCPLVWELIQITFFKYLGILQD